MLRLREALTYLGSENEQILMHDVGSNLKMIFDYESRFFRLFNGHALFEKQLTDLDRSEMVTYGNAENAMDIAWRRKFNRGFTVDEINDAEAVIVFYDGKLVLPRVQCGTQKTEDILNLIFSEYGRVKKENENLRIIESCARKVVATAPVIASEPGAKKRRT